VTDVHSESSASPRAIERSDGPVTEDQLADIFALESVKGFGPAKFKDLHLAGISPSEALDNPTRLPLAGKRGDQLKAAIAALPDDQRPMFRERARRQLDRAAELGVAVVVHGDPRYPPSLFDSNYAVPVLYIRGSVDVASHQPGVACVGSRAIRPPYVELQERFARLAVEEGFAVVSGFAMGADRIAHEAVWKAGGRTIAVMPNGLDLCFPPENRELWRELLDYEGAAFVSEFAFATKASALTLRKRNKMIVAFAQGVLVGQSSSSGGAMNAYRFALEQKKHVATFEHDGVEDTSGNELITRAEAGLEDAIPRGEGFDDASLRWLEKLASST
jgi:DNA processing protein